MTIQELSEQLGISRNSTHVQVRKLEAAGIIEKQELRMSNAAGKPAYEYRTSPGSEDVHSTAYKTVLDALTRTLGEELSESKRLELLEKTGRSLARSSGLEPGDDVVADIQRAVDAVNSLGAMAKLETNGEEKHISCYSCPVATMVHHEPLTCKMVAAMFSEASGRKVSVTCKKNETVVCGFEIH